MLYAITLPSFLYYAALYYSTYFKKREREGERDLLNGVCNDGDEPSHQTEAKQVVAERIVNLQRKLLLFFFFSLLELLIRKASSRRCTLGSENNKSKIVKSAASQRKRNGSKKNAESEAAATRDLDPVARALNVIE